MENNNSNSHNRKYDYDVKEKMIDEKI